MSMAKRTRRLAKKGTSVVVETLPSGERIDGYNSLEILHARWHQFNLPADLTGRRVLIHCNHGLGDTIQFIRYAAPLRAIARDVAVRAPAELLPLLVAR